MSIADDLANGDRRSALLALRRLLASSLVDAEPGPRAQLAKQFRDTLADLEAMPNAKEVSRSDDLAAHRAARRAAAKGDAQAAGGNQ